MRTFAVLTVALAACSEPPRGPINFVQLGAITLRGHAFLQDGTPARQRGFQVRFLGNGVGLFSLGGHHCSEGDDHAQALQVVNVVTAQDGSFFVSAPMDGFVRATDERCSMLQGAALRLQSLDVKMQTDADAVSCLAYCRGRGPDSACLSDCVSRGKKFVWGTSLTARDVGSHLDVALNQLGPPLSPAAPADPALPDLQVDAVAAASSLQIDHKDFAPGACEIEDECVAGPGHRTLIRFDGVIENLGQGDLVLGDPAGSPYFSFSECHGHYHLKDILTAELIDPVTGSAVVREDGRVASQKQGFCLKDVDQVAGDEAGKYDCDNQGLTSGWSDVYTRELGCQWLDVTDVAPGNYVLRLTVNAAHSLPEGNFANNSALIPVAVP